MHAVKLLSAMVDDSTLFIIQMVGHCFGVWGVEGGAWHRISAKEETTERPAKSMSVSK